MKGLGLASVDALDRHAWKRKTLWEIHADPGLSGAPWDSSQGEQAIKWRVCVISLPWLNWSALPETSMVLRPKLVNLKIQINQSSTAIIIIIIIIIRLGFCAGNAE